MFSILTIITIVIVNHHMGVGATNSQPVHNYSFKDFKNWNVTSEVMQPYRLLNFSL
jgi:hypothetical protein